MWQKVHEKPWSTNRKALLWFKRWSYFNLASCLIYRLKRILELLRRLWAHPFLFPLPLKAHTALLFFKSMGRKPLKSPSLSREIKCVEFQSPCQHSLRSVPHFRQGQIKARRQSCCCAPVQHCCVLWKEVHIRCALCVHAAPLIGGLVEIRCPCCGQEQPSAKMQGIRPWPCFGPSLPLASQGANCFTAHGGPDSGPPAQHWKDAVHICISSHPSRVS